MPYEWIIRSDEAPEQSGASSTSPAFRLHLWPHRSLPRRGFVIFISCTCLLLSLPLLAVLGSPVLWALLPFPALAVGGVWLALDRSYRDGEIVEELTLWPDRLTLARHGPRGQRRDWQANPHWVRLELHRSGGPVPNYLTLRGGPREVEIGAFLSEEERLALHGELQRALSA
ncbi:MAG: DUF2244 domain-containing protein [Cereibacter changlensis]